MLHNGSKLVNLVTNKHNQKGKQNKNTTNKRKSVNT